MARSFTMFKAMMFRVSLSAFAFSLMTGASYAQSSGESSVHFEKALSSFNQEAYEDAYIHLKNSLKSNPDNLSAKILMGKVLMINGYLEEAETEFREALNAGADANQLADSLGKAWLLLEYYNDILTTEFRGLNRANQRDWSIIKATAYANTGETDKARMEYQHAIKLADGEARPFTALATLEIKEKNFEKAQQLLDKALSAEPDNTGALRLKGELFLSQQQVEKAITTLERAHTLDPEDPLVNRTLISAYLRAKNRIKAKEMLDKVLEQTPNAPFANLVDAWIKAEEQDYSAAARELEALSADLASLPSEQLNQRPEFIYIAALSALAQNKLEQAHTFFSQYLVLRPEDRNAKALMADTMIKLGQYRQALALMEPDALEHIQSLDSAITLANLYILNDKTFKTLDVLTRLKEQYPGNKRVELLDIKTMIAREKYDEAFAMLANSEHSDTDLNFILTYSMLLLETKQYDKALSLADKLLAQRPDSTDFLNFKAAVLIKARKWQQATPYIDKVLSQSPDHFSANFNKANILAASGNFAEAANIAESLYSRQPGNGEVALLLANLNLNLGKPEESVALVDEVLTSDLSNIRANELLVRALLAQGEEAKAQRQLNELIKIAPDNIGYKLQRIELFADRGQLERAQRELTNLADDIKDNVSQLLAVHRIALKVEQSDLANSTLERAYSLSAGNKAIAIQYTSYHLGQGNMSQVDKALTKLQQEHPQDPVVLTLSGDVKREKNQLAEAAQQYRKAMQLAPMYRIATARLYQLTLQGAAKQIFEQSAVERLENAPQDTFTRVLLADFYLNQQNFDAAKPHYERLAEIESLPQRPYILNNLANIYIDTDLAKAKALIEEAMSTEVEYPAILDTYGWVLAKSGEYERALTVLRQAFAMDSSDPAVRYHLGFVLVKLNRPEDAKRELNQALSSPKQFTERQAAESLLQQL